VTARCFYFARRLPSLDASPAPLRVLSTLGPDWELHVQILKRKGALLDGHIVLPSIPGTLASVLTPRLLRPSVLIAKAEASNVHALGSAVNRRRSRQLAAH
jgi:protein ImuA